MHTLSLICFVASLANVVRLYFRTRRPAPRAALAEPSLTAYLAADVTAGLPHEDMVRAAIVEYMADERSDVHARISKLESELDFYILGKGEGVPLSDTFPVMKQYGMVGPLDPKPCRCENPVHIQVMGREDAYCGLCGGSAPVAKWHPDTGQRETR